MMEVKILALFKRPIAKVVIKYKDGGVFKHSYHLKDYPELVRKKISEVDLSNISELFIMENKSHLTLISDGHIMPYLYRFMGETPFYYENQSIDFPTTSIESFFANTKTQFSILKDYIRKGKVVANLYSSKEFGKSLSKEVSVDVTISKDTLSLKAEFRPEDIAENVYFDTIIFFCNNTFLASKVFEPEKFLSDRNFSIVYECALFWRF